MINIIFYCKNQDYIPKLKNAVDKYGTDASSTYLFFEQPMDVLDYVYQNRPKKCVVLYETDDLDDALNISRRIAEINAKYRFILLGPYYRGPVEPLYEKGITYYIEAPYKDECIKKCIDNFVHFFNDQSGKTITLKNKKDSENINLRDIRYIMSDKRKVVIYLDQREISHYCKLDELEEMLGSSFLRCHQSFIVNMQKIKLFVEDGLQLDDEEFVPVSRKRYFAAKREYLSYITGNKLEIM